MTILVTGGAGYIGSHTARMLVKEGFDVLIVDNLSTGRRELAGDIPLEVGDLRDRDFLHGIFAGRKIAAVLHFASLIQVGESCARPDIYYSHNLRTTINLLDAMLEAGVGKFIFSSSAAVYGTPVRTPITEDHPVTPINPYGRTKLMVETILEDLDKALGFRSVRLRYFNAAGADPEGRSGECHSPETHLIPNVILAAMGEKDKLSVFGSDFPTPDGTAVRDYIHVSDLAAAHVKALEWLLADGATEYLNLGTNRGYSVLEIIRKVEEVTGLKVPYEIGPRRAGDPPVLLASRDKAGRILDWEPRMSSIETIIGTAWNWHKKTAA